jgi:hypothetical protein
MPAAAFALPGAYGNQKRRDRHIAQLRALALRSISTRRA